MANDIKILIVEDEILIAHYIKEILEEYGYSNISLSHSVNEATEKIATFFPEIILMDINIEGNFEGIALSQCKNEDASVIFITGQSDLNTVENALSCSPEIYLTKPIRKVELISAVKIISARKKKNHIVVKNGYKKININLTEILYIQSDKNYIDIVTKTSKVTLRAGLIEFAKQLPSYFKQIHRSIFINTKYLEKIESEEVILNGKKLPFSRKFRQNLF